MHAFLIIGKDQHLVSDKANEISKNSGAKITSHEIKKIEDVRKLNQLTRLTLIEPTAIFIKDIDKVTEEALNAFLKNLEEPQEGLSYILTASNLSNVLPTVISRCQIIRITGSESTIKNEEIGEFEKMNVSEKLAYVDKIKDRGVAIKFLEEFIDISHKKLHEKSVDLTTVSANIKVATQALVYLKANGNVVLQLANFVINLV